jgi:cyclic pyranopterin phosphate synthase
MPPEGVQWIPHNRILTFEETLRVCGIMARLGIRKVRITGGEPLVRRGLASFLKAVKALPGIEKTALTTNGTLLGKYLDEAESLSPDSLPDAVNISLDALGAECLNRIGGSVMGPGGEAAPNEIMRSNEIILSIDRLLKKNITVKVNCVPVRGYNEEELVPLAALAKDRNIDVRFIELMPFGSAGSLEPVTGSETAAIVEKAFGILTPFTELRGSGPAVYHSLSGFKGKIGFINPLSHGFCESCNRLRLTSEGFLKPCLSSTLSFDLREPLRSGADDEELAGVIVEAIARKPEFHSLSDVYGSGESEEKEKAAMFGIGG